MEKNTAVNNCSPVLRVLHIVGKMETGGLETLIMNWYRVLDKSKLQFDFLTHHAERGFYDDEIEAFGGILRDTQFGAEVELEILIAEGQTQAFLDKLTDMTAGTVEGMEIGKEYRAFPVEKGSE